MKIIYQRCNESLAKVYIAEFKDGYPIEFVESVQPPYPKEEKWVLIVSTLKGCPVECLRVQGFHVQNGLQYVLVMGCKQCTALFFSVCGRALCSR